MELEAGQELNIRMKSQMSNQDWAVLDTLKITRDMNVWITYVDATGVSFYIVRGHGSGGDMECFMPRGGSALVTLSTFFEPLKRINPAYRKSRHFSKKFPHDFVTALRK